MYPSIINLQIISIIYIYLIIYQSVDISIYVSICHPFLSTCISHLCLSNHLSINSSINQSINPSINHLPIASIRVHVTCPLSLSLSILLLPHSSQRTAHPSQSWRVKEQWEEDPRRAVLCPVAVHGGAPAVTSHQDPSSDLPQDPRPQCQQG